MKRILVEAWGFDTSTLTKTGLISQLIGHGCTVKTRGRVGQFKTTDRKQSLVDLLHSKLQVPPPYTSVTAFLETARATSEREGDVAVLAMSAAQPAIPVPPTTKTHSREVTSDSEDEDLDTFLAKKAPPPSTISSGSDSEDCKPLRSILSDIRASRRASASKVQTQVSDDSGEYSTDDGDGEESSSEDTKGVVHIGDKFVLSDDDGGGDVLTVKRIVHGGIVYVEEDDDTCCLSYVRTKVSLYQS